MLSPAMTTSQAGYALIESEEECRLEAYQDEGGVWTCGWGDTGPDIVQGTVWTQYEADTRLDERVAEFESCVNNAVNVVLSQPQFDALIDFCYNDGCEAFQTSTLLKLLNAGDFAGAAGQFERWDKVTVGGLKVVSAGLLKRRQKERALFESGGTPA